MRRLIVGFFAAIGFFTMLFVGAVLVIVAGLRPSVTPLPANIILTVDLTRDLPEGASEDPLLRLIVGAKPTLRDVLDAIEAARDDPRVKVLLARVGDDELGLAKIQEVRDAIAAFRNKGKLAIAFADTFGIKASQANIAHWLQPDLVERSSKIIGPGSRPELAEGVRKGYC